MYEANPMAFLIEQAGGRGETGRPILTSSQLMLPKGARDLGDPVGVDQLLNTLRR